MPPSIPGATDDEEAAIAAMFQTQTANWEEAQEKLSQSVSLAILHVVASFLMHAVFSLSPLVRRTYPYVEPDLLKEASQEHRMRRRRGRCLRAMCAIGVGKKVCLVHGLKWISVLTYIVGHWIKDCPTNNDRDYDNRPRIKRTTGIPRSFLKAVENPDGATLVQGVMVTPEGGYVVAQPDL